MSATAYLVWFVLMAVATNVVIYGGIALAYFGDKRREERRIAAAGGPARDELRPVTRALREVA